MKIKPLNNLSVRLDDDVAPLARKCFDAMNREHIASYGRRLSKSDFMRQLIVNAYNHMKETNKLLFGFAL